MARLILEADPAIAGVGAAEKPRPSPSLHGLQQPRPPQKPPGVTGEQRLRRSPQVVPLVPRLPRFSSSRKNLL